MKQIGITTIAILSNFLMRKVIVELANLIISRSTAYNANAENTKRIQESNHNSIKFLPDFGGEFSEILLKMLISTKVVTDSIPILPG